MTINSVSADIQIFSDESEDSEVNSFSGDTSFDDDSDLFLTSEISFIRDVQVYFHITFFVIHHNYASHYTSILIRAPPVFYS